MGTDVTYRDLQSPARAWARMTGTARQRRSFAMHVAVILAGSIAIGTLATLLSAPVVSYEALLPKVVPSSEDAPADPQTTLYAATQGLALSAAAAVGDEEQVAESRGWLLDDMRAGGWGTGWEIDAFGDGAITPANTPYAETTGLAIEGLLDAGVDSETVERISSIVMRWATDGWRNTGSGGFFWYSLAHHDAVYSPSSSAILMGATARMLDAHPTAFTPEERRTLTQRIDDALEHLAETQTRLLWITSAAQSVPQDLRQHVSVLWGAERARDAGFAIPWTRADAVESLELFQGRNQLEVWPTDAPMTADMYRRRLSAFLIAGVGFADAFTNTWGGPDYSTDLRLSLASSPSVPRYTAYALRAVATQPRDDG